MSCSSSSAQRRVRCRQDGWAWGMLAGLPARLLRVRRRDRCWSSGYFEEVVCSPPNKSECESSVFPFSSSDTSRISRQHIQLRMLWTPILALLLLPLTLVSAALDAEQDKLVKLAAAGNGVIKLDEATFNLLTHPKRTWSAAIQFTAMDNRRKCIPCKCVLLFSSLSHPLIWSLREFKPSWDTVAKAWAQTPTEHRDVHFFATIDFDDAQAVFQRVSCDQ